MFLIVRQLTDRQLRMCEVTKIVIMYVRLRYLWEYLIFIIFLIIALQHIGSISSFDKPFVCDQCGQSYRYRSAYVKHREQNHRARLPADKLFSCDVCGMQFRYLKSFKKHRLNHALEKLHGKSSDMLKEVKYNNAENDTAGSVQENSSDQVSSSNETINVEEESSPVVIKKEISDDIAGNIIRFIRTLFYTFRCKTS